MNATEVVYFYNMKFKICNDEISKALSELLGKDLVTLITVFGNS